MSGVKHIGLIGLGSRWMLFLNYSKIDSSFKIVAICLAVTFTMFNDFLNSLRARKSAIPLEDAILWSSPIWSWNKQ